MCQHARLPPSFWQDAVEIALHIYNRQPMCCLDWSTPISKWNGDIPDVSYFKVFGSQAYAVFLFVPKRQMSNHPCCLFHSTVITSMSLINQMNLNHRKMFRPHITTNFHLWKVNTPIHRSLLKKALMINSHHDLRLLMHLLLIDHLPFLQHLMTQKNLDAEQEFVIPIFFLIILMATNLLSRLNEI